MSSVIHDIERAQLRQGIPSFDPGDRVRVHFQVVEGSRRRTQVFEGIVLRRQGSGVRETFTVRKQSFGVGVERTFPLHSPKIEKLEIAARGDVRRAKLYYLRGRIGKAARVAERRWGIDDELVSTPTAAAEAGAVDAEGVSQAAEDAELAAEAADATQDDASKAAGPVAEDGESSSQAAGEDTQPAGPVAEDDASSSQAAGDAPSSTPPAGEASEEGASNEPEAESAEAAEEQEPEAETDEAPEASSEAEQGTEAGVAEAGETEDSAAADDAGNEAPDGDSGDSGGDSA